MTMLKLKLLPYLVYPLSLFLGFAGYFLSYSLVEIHLLSVYAGAFLAGLVVVSLELMDPLHEHWKPTLKEVLVDLFFYTVAVQIFIPLILYSFSLLILNEFGFKDGVLFKAWPSELHVFYQFLILTVIAEFFQYWWHRLSHTYPLLWPAHAIHHMPSKLYSLNTSRFHFIDKGVEFVITILVFLLLGASFEVVSYYYIFFAVTGFIQHCNLNVKLGILDYVIASGETHRFHHDSNVKLGKINFANNLVIWDLVFGTFKKNEAFPLSNVGMKKELVSSNLKGEILHPLKETFTKDNGTKLQYHFFSTILNTLLPFKIYTLHFRDHLRLRRGARYPQRIQETLLLDIIQTNSKTLFGNDHEFQGIKNLNDFKTKVPIRDYEELRPYFERVLKGEEKILSEDNPYYFTKTSGTTGKAKYLPVTPRIQESYLRAQQILAYSLYAHDPKTFNGLLFTIVGSKEEEVLLEKWSAGSMSGKLFSLTPEFLKKKHTFSTELGEVQNHEERYLLLAALALLSPEVSFYISPNPSTLLKIFETINVKREEITALLKSNHPMLGRFSHNQARALRILKSPINLQIKDVWPSLRSMVLWTGGSCSYLIPQIRASAGDKPSIVELGYLCSEFYGTVTVDASKNLQIPTLLDNFFEFIERSSYEDGSRETLLVHELEVGKEYYIIVTTTGGLYRYFINDIVKVTSRFENTPTISFVQKGKGVTNIVGEKLSEYQIVSFFDCPKKLGFDPKFFICLADSVTQSYTLYLEPQSYVPDLVKVQHDLHQHLLKMNIEYESKIESLRLKPIEIRILKPGTGQAFKDHCLAKGQRELQFKYLHLQNASEVDFPFKTFVQGPV